MNKIREEESMEENSNYSIHSDEIMDAEFLDDFNQENLPSIISNVKILIVIFILKVKFYYNEFFKCSLLLCLLWVKYHKKS